MGKSKVLAVSKYRKKRNANDDKSVTTTVGVRVRDFILRFARENDSPFHYQDLQDESKRLKLKISQGTLRNNMSLLVSEGLIFKFPKEKPACFCLREYAKKDMRWNLWQKNDKTPMRVKNKIFLCKTFDFENFLEMLGWDNLCYIHNIRIEFDCKNPVNVNSEFGWTRFSINHSWKKKFNFELPLTVLCYDNGRVQVSVRCTKTPIPFDFSGITRLTAVLGELKGHLGWQYVTSVVNWEVVGWHYGKDCVREVNGYPFNVTYETWAKTIGRIYLKHEIRRVRIEEIQNPKISIQDLHKKIIYDDCRREN